MEQEEVATRVPLVSEAWDFLRNEAGIGSEGPSLPTSRKDTIDLSTTLPKELPSEEEMSSMSHYSLEELRTKYKSNPLVKNYVTPYAHRALNRELIQEGGGLKIAAMPIATAAYALGKAGGFLPTDYTTSTAVGKEFLQGMIGVGEGLSSLLSPKEENKIQRSESPEVTRHFEIKKQVETLLPSLINTESSGQHIDSSGTLTTSPKGAKGITQVLPATAKNPGYGVKPLQNETKEEYIRFTKDYLTKMIQVFDDVEKGVAAYNAGPGAIHRAISKSGRTGRDWKEFIPKETKDYIKKVSLDNETTA